MFLKGKQVMAVILSAAMAFSVSAPISVYAADDTQQAATAVVAEPEETEAAAEDKAEKEDKEKEIKEAAGNEEEIVVETEEVSEDGKEAAKAVVQKTSMTSSSIKASITSGVPCTYNGKPQKPTVQVKDGSKVLQEKVDYYLRYTNNSKAGEATIEVVGKGSYKDSKVLKFTIGKADNPITASNITKAYSEREQTAPIKPEAKYKSGIKYSSDNPRISVNSSGTIKVQARYTGKATITITIPESANYKGSTKKITVTVASAGKISDTGAKVFISDSSVIKKVTGKAVYNGKPQTPAVQVTFGKQKLEQGIDYSLSYRNNTNAGKGTVTIIGKGMYSGSATLSFTIAKGKGVVNCNNKSRYYSGQKIIIPLEASSNSGGKLKYKSSSKLITVSADGTMTISPKFIGKATVTITCPATTNYQAASKTINVTVNLHGATIHKLTNPKTKEMGIYWSKDHAADGYGIWISTSSSFKNPKKVVINKASELEKIVTGLVKGKKYYVRIRSFKKSGSKYIYSAWSPVKSITLKK